MRHLFVNVLVGLLSLQGALLITGCSGGSDSRAEAADATTGTFSMPLVAEAGGHLYRLQGEMYVSGPDSRWISLYGDQEQVSASLTTGQYYGSLYWYGLSRDDGSGNFVTVDAELVSDNYVNFSIFNQTTTTVSFQFETDGQLITVGGGNLNVDFEVTETPPLCTPLGSDCAVGTWCPPPELTGSQIACFVEGSVAEGESCRSPLDCVANTSCFDFGSAAVCTRLCLSSEFGEPCSEGSTCTEQGVDYGVCVPNQ